MRTMTVTEFSRKLSKTLDTLEYGGDEIILLRNNQPIAKLSSGAARMTALEALSDIYRTLDYDDGKAWIKDTQKADRLLVREVRDPWA